MKMIIAAASLFPLAALAACGDRATVQVGEPDGTGRRSADVVQSVSDHPLFATLRDDDALTADFKTYMNWVAGLRVRGGVKRTSSLSVTALQATARSACLRICPWDCRTWGAWLHVCLSSTDRPTDRPAKLASSSTDGPGQREPGPRCPLSPH